MTALDKKPPITAARAHDNNAKRARSLCISTHELSLLDAQCGVHSIAYWNNLYTWNHRIGNVDSKSQMVHYIIDPPPPDDSKGLNKDTIKNPFRY